MNPLLGVAVAGAVGAPARYIVDQWVQQRTNGEFPFGTFVINLSGSFLLGLITGLALYHGLGKVPKTILGTGFCGAFTAFSTFSYETVRLVEDGALEEAFRNVVGGVVLGLVAAGRASP